MRQITKYIRVFIIISVIIPNQIKGQERITPEHNFFFSDEMKLFAKLDRGLSPTGRNGSRLGEEVSNLGDVNGDGYDDWAIGLQSAAIYETSLKVGKVYIYFGNNTIDNEKDPDLILSGEADSDLFGSSISNAGDVNNDGYADIIIGAYKNDGGGENAGRAYIFYGGESMDSLADVILTGEAAEDQFAISVSNAGDVNRDGYDDVLVGAWWSDAGGEDAGSAYIFYGDSVMDNKADIVFTGEEVTELFGFSVSYAGDINDDGYGDIIIGSHGNASGGTKGKAKIYFGGLSMDTAPDATLIGEELGDMFGYSVSGAGDVNNDGYADVIVGAFHADWSGKAYIFLGDSLMDQTADLVLSGYSDRSEFGESVSTAGDINDDGYSDIIVGASRHDPQSTEPGKVYVYYGSSDMDNKVDIVLSGENARDNFGGAVSNAGDLNKDGFDDIIVGASGYDSNGAGRVYIYLGNSSVDSVADVFMTGEACADYFGYSVSHAGDINNDGYADIIIGAPQNDTGDFNAGQAYIYYGGPDLDNEANIILSGEGTGAYFGHCVSSAGDVNSDGYDDVIVGAYGYEKSDEFSGLAYIFFGGSPMDTDVDVVLSNEMISDKYGYSVSGAGDVNNDGYDDVIVGAYENSEDGLAAGRAYVYYGSSPMDSVVDVVLQGFPLERFGRSVSTAGDVNNDGYDDIIVGADFAFRGNAGGDFVGSAYLYYGGQEMDNTFDVKFTGEGYKNHFGNSVASAGDVNNDGYNDVIIGASGGGRAYIFNGGSVMNNIPDVVFEGEAPVEDFGNNISSAGDVNGDGYDDVVVGASRSNTGGSLSGRIYIFIGSSTMDNIPDIVFSGEASNDIFGTSVSGLGDQNNDGYDEVLVGAPGNSAIGNLMGRAYVYRGDNMTVIQKKVNYSPPQFELYQNYPNPFNPETTIKYQLLKDSHVTIKIYNIQGKEIITLVDGRKEAGYYSIKWDGTNNYNRNIASGIYFYRLEAKAGGEIFIETNKMIKLN